MSAVDAGRFDRMALDVAEGRLTRRRLLRLMVTGAAAGALGSIGFGGAVARAADACGEGERRVPIRDVGHLESCEKKVPKSGAPSFNGCGATGEVIGRDAQVPDGIPGIYDFYEPCKAHDICYGTCGSSQQTCDDNFFNDMTAYCNAEHAWWSPIGVSCRNYARLYHLAVSSAGEEAHASAQVEACDCCEPSCVHCSCNDVVYTSVQRCLDECRVSLGCFTGICEPIECQ